MLNFRRFVAVLVVLLTFYSPVMGEKKGLLRLAGEFCLQTLVETVKANVLLARTVLEWGHGRFAPPPLPLWDMSDPVGSLRRRFRTQFLDHASVSVGRSRELATQIAGLAGEVPPTISATEGAAYLAAMYLNRKEIVRGGSLGITESMVNRREFQSLMLGLGELESPEYEDALRFVEMMLRIDEFVEQDVDPNAFTRMILEVFHGSSDRLARYRTHLGNFRRQDTIRYENVTRVGGPISKEEWRAYKNWAFLYVVDDDPKLLKSLLDSITDRLQSRPAWIRELCSDTGLNLLQISESIGSKEVKAYLISEFGSELQTP